MITFTLITTTVAIVSLPALIREWFKHSETKEMLSKEASLRQGCQMQLENKERHERDLEATIRRVRWECDQDLKRQADTLSCLRDDLRASRSLNREQEKVIDGYIFSDITSIKFTAHIPDTGWRRTEFKLGIGSCGKEVTSLHWKELDDRYELTQTCTDGERKEFTYYKKDVAGRIEIAYKVSNTTH